MVCIECLDEGRCSLRALRSILDGGRYPKIEVKIPFTAQHPHQKGWMILVEVHDVFNATQVIDTIVDGHDDHNTFVIEPIEDGHAYWS